MPPEQNEEVSCRKAGLRPVTPGDDEFLMQVYASTRQAEMASWGWDPSQQKNFVQMQFAVRSQGYAAAYPSAERSIICIGDVPAGTITIFRSRDEIRLVDIALLPEFRGRGIGGELIGILISEAARSNSPLKLSVLRSNPAGRLYERLGFIASGGDAMYCEMEIAPVRTGTAETARSATAEKGSHAGKSE